VTLSWRWQRDASVNPELAAVLNRLLNYKPSDRFPCANDVLQALPPVKTKPVLVAQTPVGTVSATQQNTLALVGKRRATTGVTAGNAGQVLTANERSPIDFILGAPLLLVKATAYLMGGTVRLLFGVVKFTVSSIFKLVYRLMVAALVIALLAWAMPQLLALIPRMTPALKSAQGSRLPSEEQRRADYLETRCKELGIDYVEFMQSVNEQFYSRYPERKGKLLSNDEKDKAMRDEWYAIAEELLQKPGNPGERNFLKKVAESE
jgi:hypothetical protein